MSNDNEESRLDFGEFDIPFKSKLNPVIMDSDSKFNFRCHKDVSCFNECCKKIDITLTPYDIVRMKQHLNMTSQDFLNTHTVPFQLDGHGTPGVKMRSTEEGACHFVTDEGCSIYEDRPTSCRYYPAGVMSMKAFGAESDDMKFFQIKEDHCKGHDEDREISIDDYRTEQGVKEYDVNNLEYYRLILKKKSAGPSIGTPPEMSMQLFFMANYDMDRFRRFVESDSFAKTYDIPVDQMEKLKTDDYALMHFGYDLLKQVLFGDKSITEREGAYEKRIEERGEIIKLRQQAERDAVLSNDPRYKPENEVKEEDLK